MMAEFMLIHGGMHGGWYWDELEKRLKDFSHRVRTVEYDCTNPKVGGQGLAADIAGRYWPREQPSIIVGLSMGGLIIPLIADLQTVQALVYLCALVPEPGKSVMQQETFVAGAAVDKLIPDGEGGVTVSLEGARHIFYSDLDESAVRAAFRRIRPRSLTSLVETTPLRDWPSVPTYSICTTDDNIVSL
jgi:pimeloyl-ACP methyl ester carboxylesterase